MKKFVTIALSVLIALSCTFSTAACAKGGEPSSEVPPAPSTPSTPSTPTEPATPDDKGKEDDGGKEESTSPTKTKAEAVAAFNAAVQSIQADKNFTYTELGTEYVAEFDGAKLKVTEGGVSVFYATEAEKNYCYALQDSVWQKDFSETTVGEVFTALTAVYGDAVWSEYDSEANQLIGNASGGTIRATVLDGTVTVEVAQKKFTLTKLGTTAVSLPADAIDDTDPSNFIFTTDASGEYVWNVKAIKDVLEPWLKNEGEGNQYGKDMFAVVRVNDKYKTREVLYINVSRERISFGVIHEVSGQSNFGETYFNDPSLYETLSNKASMTKKEFRDYLMQLDARRVRTSIVDFDVEYTTLDQDYATAHKQEFVPMTLNIIEKGKENSEFGEFFENLSVVFGYSTAQGPIGKHGCSWAWGCIAQNTITLMMYYICATISGIGQTKAEALSQVVNGNMENFSIWDISISELDKGNIIIYENMEDDISKE